MLLWNAVVELVTSEATAFRRTAQRLIYIPKSFSDLPQTCGPFLPHSSEEVIQRWMCPELFTMFKCNVNKVSLTWAHHTLSCGHETPLDQD